MHVSHLPYGEVKIIPGRVGWGWFQERLRTDGNTFLLESSRSGLQERLRTDENFYFSTGKNYGHDPGWLRFPTVQGRCIWT